MKKNDAPNLSKVKYVAGKAPVAGKVVVIDVWASWCGPCMQSIPHLVNLQAKFADAQFVGLTDEDVATVAKMHGMLQKINYAIGAECGEITRPLMEKNGVQGIPHCFVFSKSGELVLHCHPMDPQFEKAIQIECGKEASFGGEAHSLASGKKAVETSGVPSAVHVDEQKPKVKIAVRSSKGETSHFVLNDSHTIGDLKKLVINKGLAANASFDLVQSFPKKVFANSESVASLNGVALVIA